MLGGASMKYNKKTIIISIIISILTVTAFTLRPNILNVQDVTNWTQTNNKISIFIVKWRCVLNGYGMQNALLTILLAIAYNKIFSTVPKIKLSENKLELLLACFFSFWMVVGQQLASFNSLEYLFKGSFYTSVTIVKFIGYSIFFFIIICWGIQKILNYNQSKNDGTPGRISNLVFEQHPFLCPFLIILICWLPYLIACFPGVVQWDGLRQLKNAMNLAASDNSHPVFTSLLMGAAMKCGKYLGSDNLGVFIYVFPQMLIAAAVTAYSIKQLKDMKSPYLLKWGALAYFSFISLWPLYAVSMFKDTLFYIVFLEFIILTLQIIVKKELFWKDWKNIVLLVLMLILLELIRPNGVYYVILCVPLIILAGWKSWRNCRGWICFAIVILAYIVANHIIIPSLGVAPGRKNEAFSLLFQQTARYINKYEDEVTKNEKKIISTVLDYDVLLNEYDPQYADPVKNSYNYQATNEDLKQYFKIWFQQFCKHPAVYIEATLNGTYGYFYPNKTEYREGLGAYHITYDPRIYTGEFELSMIPELETFRNILENLSYIVRSVPVLGFVFSNGIYTWIVLFCVVVMIKKKDWRAVTPYIPALLTVAFCVVSPVNAYIRYMRPVMVATPLLIAWMLYRCRQ